MRVEVIFLLEWGGSCRLECWGVGKFGGGGLVVGWVLFACCCIGGYPGVVFGGVWGELRSRGDCFFMLWAGVCVVCGLEGGAGVWCVRGGNK